MFPGAFYPALERQAASRLTLGVPGYSQPRLSALRAAATISPLNLLTKRTKNVKYNMRPQGLLQPKLFDNLAHQRLSGRPESLAALCRGLGVPG